MSETVEEAKAALKRASEALSRALHAHRQDLKTVGERHAPLIAAAQEVAHLARVALKEAQSVATPDHEWEGRTVARVVDKRKRPCHAPHMVREVGVVVTYRPGVDITRGPYGVDVGTPLVQLLRKDGEPGKTFVLLNTRWNPFKLVEQSNG